MGTMNDPGGKEAEFKQELGRLADLTSEADARAIRTWANKLNGEYSARTNLVLNVRTTSRRASLAGFLPLTEMENENDFYELHDLLRTGEVPDDPYLPADGLSEGSLRNVRKGCRLFFRDGLSRDWAEEIEIGASPKTKITEGDIYTAEEVTAILDACRNPRDKAFIALLLSVGFRLVATLSIRVKDVTLGGSATGFVHLNPEAVGLKGAEGKRALLWATPYIKNWLDVHPYSDEPTAALFCPLKEQGEATGRDPTDPLDPWSVQQQLRRIGTRAGLDKPVSPHRFRHTAITRMVRDGLSEQVIKWRVGWDPDSSQFDRYVHLRDEEMLDAVLEHYDLKEDTSDIGRPTFEDCPNCGVSLPWANPKSCPECGILLTETAEGYQVKAEPAVGAATPTSATVEGTLTETAERKVERYDELKAQNEALLARMEKLETKLGIDEEPVEE